MSTIFITGGTGFVGGAVVAALLARGHSIHALVKGRPLKISGDRIKPFTGDLFDDAVLDSAMAGCDAVIHLVGIIVENPGKGITFDRIHYQGTVKVVDAARRIGIRRYVHMSALGASATSKSMYLRTKFHAGEFVRDSGLDWTIIEPSLIYGPGGEFTKTEAGWACGKSFPFVAMPYFGTGLLGRGTPKKIQPLYVDDVARAFADALDNTGTIGQVFPIGGPEQMTWPEMHRIFARILTGRTKATLAVPAWYAKAITHVAPSSLLPFTRDQVFMSQEDNVCDMAKFQAVFGWKPSTALSEAVIRAVEGSGRG